MILVSRVSLQLTPLVPPRADVAHNFFQKVEKAGQIIPNRPPVIVRPYNGGLLLASAGIVSGQDEQRKINGTYLNVRLTDPKALIESNYYFISTDKLGLLHCFPNGQHMVVNIAPLDIQEIRAKQTPAGIFILPSQFQYGSNNHKFKVIIMIAAIDSCLQTAELDANQKQFLTTVKESLTGLITGILPNRSES